MSFYDYRIWLLCVLLKNAINKKAFILYYIQLSDGVLQLWVLLFSGNCNKCTTSNIGHMFADESCKTSKQHDN